MKGNQGTGAGPEDAFARLDLGGEIWSTPLAVDTTYLIVGELSKSAPGLDYDQFSLWVNPGAYDSGAPDASVSVAGSCGSPLVAHAVARTPKTMQGRAEA